MITIVGLGTEKDDLTEKGRKAILSADRVILRTERAECAESVKGLGVKYQSLDYLYENSRSFDTLQRKIAQVVCAFGRTENVAYCVEGSVSEDRSSQLILKRSKGAQVVGGIGKAQRALETAGLLSCSYTAVSAYDLAQRRSLSLPAVVYDIDDSFLAGDVKLYLADRVGEEREIYFVQGGKAKKIPVYELDRQREYGTACAVVGEIPLLEKTRFDIGDLQDIILRLRQPDGCPWDKVQTPESIRASMIEEAYELVDAIDSGDPDKIREETGDVLLQAVFHAVMQEERGAFNLTDSLSELCHKLIFRHSHIFGADRATDAESALSVWEANKAKEKGQDTYAKAVNDVPLCFPALLRAQKVQKRAGKSGFDFASVQDAEKKIMEELQEWQHARDEGDERGMQEELGDLLFSVVNAGRLAGVDCEMALKESVRKFVRRFNDLENAVLADGKKLDGLTPEEMDGYYRKIK